jgi:DNA-binding transcriptional MerR regulator
MPEVTSIEAGEIIGVSDETIRQYVDRDLLKARRQGLKRKVFIEMADLAAFAREYDFRFDQARAQQITGQ